MPSGPAELTVLDHPLIHDKLARLRDRTTAPAAFARLVREIAALMCGEVTRHLDTSPVEVTTPLEAMTGRRLRRPIALVPILRAGLAMVDGFRDIVPEASVGHIGLYRDHVSLRPVPYYIKAPEPLDQHDVLVLDPMLATGGSAAHALDAMTAAGATRLRFCCLVAAPEGIDLVRRRHPQVPIVAAALDRELNPNGYILPGLGDAGDRTFGTS